MIEIPEEDLIFKMGNGLDILCLDIVRQLRKYMIEKKKKLPSNVCDKNGN